MSPSLLAGCSHVMCVEVCQCGSWHGEIGGRVVFSSVPYEAVGHVQICGLGWWGVSSSSLLLGDRLEVVGSQYTSSVVAVSSV